MQVLVNVYFIKFGSVLLSSEFNLKTCLNMNHSEMIKELLKNRGVFRDLLSGTEKDQYLWKPEPGKWCLLEVVCHLYDEEREDFRPRLKHTLKTSDLPMPEIDPMAWPKERNYLESDFEGMLDKFLLERLQSGEWLSELKSPEWTNAYLHPKLGLMSAEMFLANWLAHDYLHIRQVVKLKHAFLKTHLKINLSYAGEW